MRPFFIVLLLIFCVSSQPDAFKSFFCDRVVDSSRFHQKLKGYSLFRQVSTQCSLHSYDDDDVAECLDSLRTKLQLKNKVLHFVFIGDSRIRTAFHSFWPMIPNYDQKWEGPRVNRKVLRVHTTLHVDSHLLNSRVTFLWRPSIKDNLLAEFKKWIAGTAPSVIITGFASHQMGSNNPRSNVQFANSLKKLVPLMKSLSSKSLIIWLHQSPLIETGNVLTGPTNSKFDGYNDLSRRLLEGTGVVYWDSFSPLAEDYVRGCALNRRKQASNFHACFDYIHTGYVAIDRGSQILFNAMCNRLLTQSLHPAVNMTSDACCI